MLKVTADLFSGRPNPEWIIADENEVRGILKELATSRTYSTAQAPASGDLGFRGLLVEPLSDELARDYDVPPTAYIAIGAAATGKAMEITDRLISSMSTSPAFEVAPGEEALTFEPELQELLSEQMRSKSRESVPDTAAGAPEAEVEAAPAEAEVPAVTCTYDRSAYNPGFWNNDPIIRSRNNCYNYASNKRTDTFAQPGRGCGRMYTAITCAEVTRAALCDGLHRRYDCFPASESPRYLVALVVAPGPSFRDFHWYRLMREGFWGHKPGGTAVKNTDNSGRVITNPQSCNRGPYTQFCGYFYTCRSQRIR